MELATAQHGVVSTRQLKALGYGRNSASKANRVGRLRRVHRGVYAVGHERLTWHGHCMAAVLACPQSLASHFSAAWLWGLLRGQPGTIHVTVPAPRRAKRPFAVHFADLPARDRAEREGIPVTGLARTILDLAAVLSITRLEWVLERAEERQLFDLVALEEILGRASHHPGAGKLRRALAIYREDPAFVRSRLEGRFLELVKAAGLPRPSMNFNVAGFELDAYWERERFAVELDVYETHGTRAAFERDRLRQEDLKLFGVEMIRVTGPRLKREPRAAIERVAALLEQRRRQLPGLNG
ncbi:MAG TPA: type IV toxin-antitoxin system AbiEi family antitoxin domain-containing protein [Solirubrobacterales bacterium]|nr:type IV toxin-antitoxin system AbiEi family antitoxin domain-containing protein [Solirubrobacterales bacterium]